MDTKVSIAGYPLSDIGVHLYYHVYVLLVLKVPTKLLYYLGFHSFDFKRHLMKLIPKTRRAHIIRCLSFYFDI
jgi:hypothetical protein